MQTQRSLEEKETVQRTVFIAYTLSVAIALIESIAYTNMLGTFNTKIGVKCGKPETYTEAINSNNEKIDKGHNSAKVLCPYSDDVKKFKLGRKTYEPTQKMTCPTLLATQTIVADNIISGKEEATGEFKDKQDTTKGNLESGINKSMNAEYKNFVLNTGIFNWLLDLLIWGGNYMPGNRMRTYAVGAALTYLTLGSTTRSVEKFKNRAKGYRALYEKLKAKQSKREMDQKSKDQDGKGGGRKSWRCNRINEGKY